MTSSAPACAMARASSPPSPGTKPRSSAPTRAAAVCSTLKPFQPSATRPESLRRKGQDGEAVGAGQSALTDDHERALRAGQFLR